MCMGDPSLPDPGNAGECCWGASLYGPARCTCWTAVHDLEQTDPDRTLRAALAAGCPPSVRPSMCVDCAYRPGSPEKSGDPRMAGSPESLEALAASGEPFWCHQGQRRTLRRVHPDGAVQEAGPGAYDPPIVDGIPWKADGQPGEMCAGWDARRRALAARAEAEL